MPGSGKSTLGKQLAAAINLPFVDLDEEIEFEEQRTIPEIFQQSGEDYFRRVESRLLAQWAGSTQSFVMATGGGAPCHLQGLEIMNQAGITIYLQQPVSTLLYRVAHRKNRPLLQGSPEELAQRLKSLMAQREPIYNRASRVVNSPTVEKISAVLGIKM